MRSGTSFFDRTVFKKTLLRFWPLWAVYLVIWTILLPLNGLMSLQMDASSAGAGGFLKTFARHTVPGMYETCLFLSVVFGALAAMAVFSHLYNARSANFFGSLPVRREGLFITHYLAGLSFLIVPNAAIFLLTVLVELAGGAPMWSGLLFWLAVSCGECFLFYSMAVFCGMFTGHLLALPAFYGILNVLVIGVVFLFQTVLQMFCYGFNSLSGPVVSAAEWFTPVYQLTASVWASWYEGSAGGGALSVEGLGVVGVYVLAAAVLTVCSFLLCRVRRLESAGDVVSVRPMQPVFKYGVSICMGLAFGFFTAFFLGLGDIGLMIAIVLWGLAGYFAAQMLLDKSFRVFRKWKGAAAVTGVFVVMFLVVGFDLTGFETRVPDPSSVEQVSIMGLNVVYLGDNGDSAVVTVTDPDQIALLTALHQAAVDQRDDTWSTSPENTGDTWTSSSLTLFYTLKNGTTMNRKYYIGIDTAQSDQPGTTAWAVEQLYADRDFCWNVYEFPALLERLEDGGRLESVEIEYNSSQRLYYYGADAAALLEAVEADFWAGRIGVRHVNDPDAGNWADMPTLRIQVEQANGSRTSVRIRVQDTASETLAALERLAETDQTGR